MFAKMIELSITFFHLFKVLFKVYMPEAAQILLATNGTHQLHLVMSWCKHPQCFYDENTLICNIYIYNIYIYQTINLTNLRILFETKAYKKALNLSACLLCINESSGKRGCKQAKPKHQTGKDLFFSKKLCDICKDSPFNARLNKVNYRVLCPVDDDALTLDTNVWQHCPLGVYQFAICLTEILSQSNTPEKRIASQGYAT